VEKIEKKLSLKCILFDLFIQKQGKDRLLNDFINVIN